MEDKRAEGRMMRGNQKKPIRTPYIWRHDKKLIEAAFTRLNNDAVQVSNFAIKFKELFDAPFGSTNLPQTKRMLDDLYLIRKALEGK
jgi:hypothetical protein